MKRRGMRIFVAGSREAMSRMALGEIVSELKRKPDASFAFPTGETPKMLYRLLCRKAKKERLDFSRASLFQLDEFLGLEKGGKKSYSAYLRKRLLSKLNFSEKNVHLFDSASRSPEADCRKREAEIRRIGIDLCLLGVGRNGHIAFNEPGSPFGSRTRVARLEEATRKQKTAFSRARMPEKAFTLGVGTIIQNSGRIIALASGKEKARAVAFAAKSTSISEAKGCPLAYLNYHKDAVLIADKKAASLL